MHFPTSLVVLLPRGSLSLLCVPKPSFHKHVSSSVNTQQATNAEAYRVSITGLGIQRSIGARSRRPETLREPEQPLILGNVLFSASDFYDLLAYSYSVNSHFKAQF